VIAHPDDEAMFMGPTIRSVTSARDAGSLHVLCLSTGDFDGLGNVRRTELPAAAAALGASPANVTVLDLPAFRDGPDEAWRPDAVGAAVWDHVRTRARPGAGVVLLTFDGAGVSGHPNHVSTYRGVVGLVRRRRGSDRGEGEEGGPEIRAYALVTVSPWRKFVGPAEVAVGSVAGVLSGGIGGLLQFLPGRSRQPAPKQPLPRRLYFFRLNPLPVWRAMAAHASQFVWYRRLFILFSRYTYVNTWREIE